MAKFRKRARRMPPHIVLPNGMWRFVKSRSAKVRTIHKAKRIRRRSSMARRRYARARRAYGKGRSIGTGILSPKGILVGAGAATLLENAGIANQIPFGKYLAGGAAGYLLKTNPISGVIGVFARDMMKGVNPGGGAGSAGYY